MTIRVNYLDENLLNWQCTSEYKGNGGEMNWFTKLTGFTEQNPDQVRGNLQLNGTSVHSQVNGRSYECGSGDCIIE